MKPINIFLLFATFLLWCSPSYSQSPDNRAWTVSAFDNTQTNEHVTYACAFETHSDKIKWIQKGGARVTEFQITSRTNTWSNIQEVGEITYQVTLDGNSGWIRFYRESGQLFIETNLQVEGKNTLPFKFMVNSTSTL